MARADDDLQRAANPAEGVGQFFRDITGRSGLEIDEQNLQFQKGQFEYEKQLQDRIFAREDSSHQRAVKDLRAAGLSPILAAGKGARAGAPISVKAPQKGTTGLQMRANMINQVANMATIAGSISRTISENRLTNAQAEYTDILAGRGQKGIEIDEQNLIELRRRNLVGKLTFNDVLKQVRTATKTKDIQALIAGKELELRGSKAVIEGFKAKYDQQLDRYLSKVMIEEGIPANPKII